MTTTHSTTVAPDPSDYESVLADHRRLVRELDVLLNGEAAAEQASLCDIVAQLSGVKRLDVLRAALAVQVAPKPAAVIARGASPADTLETLVEQYIEHGDLPAYMLDAAMEVVKNARSAIARPAAATSLEPADPMFNALENCRLLAARHRKEDWAQSILRFCKDAGVIGSPLRSAPSPALPAPVGGPQLSTDERAAFEHSDPRRILKRVGDYYDNWHTQAAWEGWQARAELASRSPAVEKEVP